MDITLNISFINTNDKSEQLKIICNKDKLIIKSKYFNSLLLNDFNESKLDELAIDLTNLTYHQSSKHIRIFFDIMNSDYNYQSKCKKDIILIMDTELEKEQFHHQFQIDYGLTAEIPIYEFYIMLVLCDYFSCDSLKEKIITYLMAYGQIFSKNVILCDYFSYDSLKEKIITYLLTYGQPYSKNLALNNNAPSLIETFVISVCKIIDISYGTLTSDLLHYTHSILSNIFLQNIYYIYLAYKHIDCLADFKKIINNINFFTTRAKFNMIVPIIEITGIELSIDRIRRFPLDNCYELINLSDGLVTVEADIFRVYDFYNYLKYEKSNQKLFKFNKIIIPDYKIGQKCIKPKKDVLKLFQEKTNGLFDNMEWNNVILTGGFIFGLINDLSTSLISSTDIDLFTYDDPDEKTAKYLLGYFNQFKPYYSVRGRVITIIIPSFPYDIQIIPTNHKMPYGVVNSFDFSYAKTYYDGDDIYSTLDGISSLKYATTIYNPTDKYNVITNSRLYKTLLKGVNIQYNPIIQNSFIDGEMIDFAGMENNEEIQMMLNKPNTIRKLANHLTGVEILPLIQTYYSSNKVSMSIDNLYEDPITKNNTQDENGGYDTSDYNSSDNSDWETQLFY